MLSKIEEKESYIYSILDSKIEEIEAKLLFLDNKVSDDISKGLEEVHSVINSAVSKYDEEIKNIEHYRLDEGDKLLYEIRSGYDYYSNLINKTYKDSLASLSNYTNKIKSEIEKAREESENKHLSNEKNYIDEYLKDYLSKLDSKIEDKVNILNDSKNQLDDMIKESFNTLNINLEEAISNFNKRADDNIDFAIKELKEKENIFNYKEYISELEDHLKTINSKIDA